MLDCVSDGRLKRNRIYKRQDLIPPLLYSVLIFSSLMALLSTGLTMAYITTKLPNFTQGSFVTVGAYLSLTSVKLWNMSPYLSMGSAFILGGVSALLMYRLALRPQIRRGAPLTSLMVTTLAVWIFFTGILNMYADYLQFVEKVSSRGFLLTDYDFTLAGEPGLLLVSTTLGVVLIFALFMLLTKTDFGIGIRATAENANLAQAIGINIDRVNDFSWFFSGALSGVAGALAPMFFFSSTNIGDNLLITMFAASILGGLTSIFGAILGGYLVGAIQIVGTNFIADYLGSWVIAYQLVIPLIMMVIVLLFVPRGLGGVNWRMVFRRGNDKKS